MHSCLHPNLLFYSLPFLHSFPPISIQSHSLCPLPSLNPCLIHSMKYIMWIERENMKQPVNPWPAQHFWEFCHFILIHPSIQSSDVIIMPWSVQCNVIIIFVILKRKIDLIPPSPAGRRMKRDAAGHSFSPRDLENIQWIAQQLLSAYPHLIILWSDLDKSLSPRPEKEMCMILILSPLLPLYMMVMLPLTFYTLIKMSVHVCGEEKAIFGR